MIELIVCWAVVGNYGVKVVASEAAGAYVFDVKAVEETDETDPDQPPVAGYSGDFLQTLREAGDAGRWLAFLAANVRDGSLCCAVLDSSADLAAARCGLRSPTVTASRKRMIVQLYKCL